MCDDVNWAKKNIEHRTERHSTIWTARCKISIKIEEFAELRKNFFEEEERAFEAKILFF